MTVAKPGASRFVRDVASVFGMQVTVAIVGIVNAFLLARLLGPAGKGAYYLLLLVPSTLLVLGHVGIPSALTYFAGRGLVHGLARRTFALALGLSFSLVIMAGLFLGLVRPAMFAQLPIELIVLVLVATPLQFVLTFGGGLLIGRRAIRSYATVMIAQAVGATVLIGTLVGILDLDVRGAILAYVILSVGAAAAIALVALRLPDPEAAKDAPPFRQLLGYGLRIWPGSMTTFFSYRADVYIISWLLASSTELGIYSIAVGLAEIVFHVPDSVSTVFFPQVAGSEPDVVARTSPEITRVTLLATAAAAVALVPAAALALVIVLPAFVTALTPLVVLLPGVVMLSVAKVLSGLITGSGRAGSVSLVAIVVSIVNVIANIALIPRLGIVGASLASTISYSMETLILVLLAARLTGQPALAFLLPRRSDFFVIRDGVKRLIAWLRPATRAASPR